MIRISENVYKTVCARLLQVDLTTPLDLCCMCLKLVGKDSCSVDDEVMLSYHTSENFVVNKISNILKLLINDDSFSEVMYMLKSVCKKCLCEAIAGYNLIQKCKNNSKLIYEAVANLDQSLSDIPDDMYNCNSLYITINPKVISKDSVIKRYFDKRRQFIPQDTALPRFVTMLESLYPRPKICSKTNIEIKDILFDPEKPNEFKCVLCQELFGNITCLRIHFYRQHHHSKDIECKECCNLSDSLIDDTFGDANTTSQLEPPVDQVQLSQQNITCQDEIESYDFIDSSTIQSEVIVSSDTAHLEQNTETEPIYTCANCKLTFKELFWYNEHIAKKSNCKGMKGAFYCDHCNRCYSHKQTLKTHILCNHMNMGVPCEICGRRYLRSTDLRQHIKRHAKEKCATCTLCGRSFVEKNYLRQHIQIVHSDEKPYQCEICSKSFMRPNNLADHMMTHKPKIECKYCHKMLKYSAMHKHVRRLHFENLAHRPIYSCNYCNTKRVFVTNHELQSHVKTHFPPEEECDICFKKYATKQDVARHRKIHFDIKSKSYIKKT